MKLLIFFCRPEICSSTNGFLPDSCSETVREPYFYVRVLAHSRLSNAKLEITGRNIASVVEVKPKVIMTLVKSGQPEEGPENTALNGRLNKAVKRRIFLVF